MTQQRDIERLLDHWLAEGSTVAPDRIADVVADRIERQFQRPAWLAERNRPMTSNLRLAAAVATIAIVGAGAVYFAGPARPNVGPPAAPPSATPVSTAPSPSPRTTSSRTFQPALRIDLPSGWVAATDDERTFALTTTTAGTVPAGEIQVRRQPVVGSNADDCAGVLDPAAGTSVTGIADSIAADERFATTPAGTVTVDGRSVDLVDIRLSPSWTETCSWSDGNPGAVLLTVSDPPGGWIGLRGDEVIRMILFDVDGIVLSITVSPTDPADFDDFAAAAMPLVESIAFTP